MSLNFSLRLCYVLGLALLLLTACAVGQDPASTPTVLPAPLVATATPVFAPTQTPVLTATLPPPPPSATPEPPTPPPVPTSTALAPIPFANDLWEKIDIPSVLQGGLDGVWLAFLNFNDTPIASASTHPLSTQEQTLYLIEPFSRQRVAIAQLPFSVGERVYISPQGTHIVYFRESQFEASGQDLGGVYMLDFVIGLSYRLFAIPSLSPRGIAGHAPVWSEDGSLLALVLPTAYATDIFLLNADGTNFRNLTQNEAYDLFPAFSPDGTRLAFVSDRTTCPTYQPQQPNTCDQANLSPPQQGNLFVLDLTTGVSRQVTDVQLTGTPRWLNNQLLAFSTGGGNALAEANTLWLVDVIAGTAVQISPPNVLGVAESWASDGGRVFYQQIGETPRLVLADNLGRELGALTQYNFPRYGVASSWSADGRFLALGGRNGRCPYGIMVFDASLAAVTAPGRNLLACDPQYAPNNVHLAYTGIRPSSASDGRLDIYIANLNGLGATNVTSNLQGQMRLLGWVGRPSAE